MNYGLTNTDISALAINPLTPEILYAGTHGGGVFKSTDGGANWTATGLAGAYVWALAVDPQSPETLYAGTGGGVFKSISAGASWTGMNDGLTMTEVQALAIDPQTLDTLYAGTWGGGVFKIQQGACSGPVVDAHPQSQTIQSGLTTNLSVHASGTAPLLYQWYRGSTGDTSNPIGGATSSNYTTPLLTRTTGYWVKASNTCGHADSNTAMITLVASIWSSGMTVGADAGGTFAVEVGVKFRSDVDGYITGIRFYKHAQNTGMHTGSLWTTGGTRLGAVDF